MRLWKAGRVEYRYLEPSQEVGDLMHTFLKLFALSRQEKANFMTTKMESFFRSLAKATAEVGLLRFGILKLDELPVAMTMCFDYNNCVYLYNSASDLNYGHLSVGLMSKVLCIKESIQKGKNRWDFLKGGESYKYHLGGREIRLYHCHIIVK